MSIKKIPIAIGIKPDQVATFTNKTISGSNNTFTNIPTSALAFNTITINGSTIPLGGSINLQVQGGSPIIDTNTTYSIKTGTLSGGARLDLDAGGSGSGTDSVNFVGGGNVTVTRLDENTIRISDAGNLGGVALTSENTATLTNKTISGTSNTLTNIPNSALTNSSITINGQSVSLGGTITIAGGGGGGSGDVTLSGIQTLSNKTISGSNNTLTNIANSSLVNPFISINGTQVALGTNFTVSGLGDVTLTGTQDLSNKTLVSPIIENARLTSALRIGTAAGGNPGIAGQVLKSTGTGIQWAYENQVTGAALTIGSGLTGTGGTEFDGSNGIVLSINTGIVATLTGSQTLSNKTLDNTTITGTLTAGGSIGSPGYVLKVNSAGNGVEWGVGGGGGGSGSFNGPGSATDNAIVRFDGTTGALAQNSLVTISDTGAITAPSVSSVIPFYYSSQIAFPSASTYNGAVAVSGNDNTIHFASNGNWIQLAKSSEAAVSTRQTFSTTTASLVANGTAFPDLTNTLKSYLLLKIQTDRAAWVRVYTSTAARTADSSRSIDVDPLPGSGVIAEVITTGASTQILTPAVIGFNDQATPVNTIYLSVTNRSATSGTVTVTLTALKLEA